MVNEWTVEFSNEISVFTSFSISFIFRSFERRVLGLALPEWNIVSAVWHREWERAVGELK